MTILMRRTEYADMSRFKVQPPAMNPVRAGLVLGSLFGLCHLGWSVLVALGWAQPVMDFVLWLHFIKPIYLVEPFNTARAVVLLVVTTSVGFVIGSIFAALWNRIEKR